MSPSASDDNDRKDVEMAAVFLGGVLFSLIVVSLAVFYKKFMQDRQADEERESLKKS